MNTMMRESIKLQHRPTGNGALRLLVLVMVLTFSFSPASASAASFGDILNGVGRVLDALNSAVTGAPMQPPAEIVEGAATSPTAATAPSAASGGSFWDRLFGGAESSIEKTMGENGHKALSQNPGFSRDKNELARLERVARRLVPTVDRKDLTYRFSIVNSDEVNAYALPGGYIYVTRGLLKSAKTDDELACVVAHELGHVNLKHGIRQAEKAGMMAAAVALMGLNDKTKKAQAAAGIAAYFANLKFSRDDEFAADRKAVEYAAKAGYDPRGMIAFFNKINRDSASTKITKYFSTHPPTNDRIRAVTQEIAKVEGKSGNAPEALPSSGYAQSGSTGTTTQVTQAPPRTSVPVSQTTVSQSQLKQSYERFILAKEKYATLVTSGAPIDQILAANKEYQAAQADFVRLKSLSVSQSAVR